MKFLKFLTLILFLTLTLDAAYLRTIRVGAFTTKEHAQTELATLKNFVKSHKNITDLQKKFNFEVLQRKSGKYYITILEPMTDKEVLQEVIDTLRIKYPDSYVTKMKKRALKTKVVAPVKKVEKLIETQKVEAKKVAESKKVEIPVSISTVKIEKEIKPKKKEVVVKKVQKVSPSVSVIPKKIEKVEPESMNEDTIYKILFFILLGLFVIVFILLVIKKRERKKIRVKEEDNLKQREERTTQLLAQIKNNDHFLSETQTAMSSIIKYSNLLLEFDLSVIQRDYAQRIKNSSSSLLNVVNNTTDISKIQVGKLHIRSNDFNIRTMINDVSTIISLDAKQNNITLHIDIAEDIPSHVIGDSMHLKQVLISLLTNSVKYTRDGEITLTLKKVYSYAHAITLGFVISDTGVGMSSEEVERITYSDQNNNSTNLSVSKQLIQMMHGDLKIYSTLDVGTTFTFNIKFDLKQ